MTINDSGPKSSRIVMTYGLPASGKSTWSKKQTETSRKIVRINKDDLRAMLHNGKHDSRREKTVLAMRDAMIETALENDLTVIVDDTNLHPKHEARLKELAEKHGTTLRKVTFDVPLSECIRRDAARAHPVGEKVIRRMWKDFLRPAPPPQNAFNPPAIIVDIDGTIANMGNRDPYRDDLAGNDSPEWTVIHVINSFLDMHPGMALIIMSGRDEGRSREVTEQWLQRHRIEYTHLFMRPAGDTRKDSIVKRELFENHVRDSYYVEAVFDDRDQVVDMWRNELGLRCFQVAEGAF